MAVLYCQLGNGTLNAPYPCVPARRGKRCSTSVPIPAAPTRRTTFVCPPIERWAVNMRDRGNEERAIFRAGGSGEGRTLVNGSPSRGCACSHHLDEIALAAREPRPPPAPASSQIQAVRLEAPWTCPVCFRDCSPGDLVFDCPGNHRRRYCSTCCWCTVYRCSCGQISSTVRRVLRSIDVREWIKDSKIDHLRLETVEAGSALLDKKVRWPPFAKTRRTRFSNLGSATRFCSARTATRRTIKVVGSASTAARRTAVDFRSKGRWSTLFSPRRHTDEVARCC